MEFVSATKIKVKAPAVAVVAFVQILADIAVPETCGFIVFEYI